MSSNVRRAFLPSEFAITPITLERSPFLLIWWYEYGNPQ
jgi:hypothetical protein